MASVAFALTGAAARAETLLNFDELPGGPLFGLVPPESQLSNQYVDAGVVFTCADSGGSPYAAVVNLGLGHAVSGTNGIHGVNISGVVTAVPITVRFVDPGNPSVNGATSAVSVRGDLAPDFAGVITLQAFNICGDLVAVATAPDTGGTMVSVSVKGPPTIHRVTFSSNTGNVAFDDFTFGEVVPLGHGDINLDGTVDVNDLLAVITAWGDCPAICLADLNCDNVVDVNDLLAVISNWG